MAAGTRISVYVRPADQWVFAAIEAFQEHARTEYGVDLSKSDVVTEALSELLSEYRNVTSTPKKGVPPAAVRSKRSIRCSNDLAWVFQRVDDIVNIKRELGMPTSFSQELIHLARNTLLSDTPYGKMVRAMLHSAHAD